MITKVNARKFVMDLIKSWTIVEFRDNNGCLEEALRDMREEISYKVDLLLDHPSMTKDQFKESFKSLTEVDWSSDKDGEQEQKEAISEANIGSIIWDTVSMLRVNGLLTYEQSYERMSSKLEVHTDITYSTKCPYCKKNERSSKKMDKVTCDGCGLGYDVV